MERIAQMNLFGEETILPPAQDPVPVLADAPKEDDAEEEDSGTPVYTWKKAKGDLRRVYCYRDADGRLQHQTIDKEDRSYDHFHHGTFTDFGYQIVYHPDVLSGWGIEV